MFQNGIQTENEEKRRKRTTFPYNGFPVLNCSSGQYYLLTP